MIFQGQINHATPTLSGQEGGLAPAGGAPQSRLDLCMTDPNEERGQAPFLT
jgi:hypothetical protein